MVDVYFTIFTVRNQKVIDPIVTDLIEHPLQPVYSIPPPVNQPGDEQQDYCSQRNNLLSLLRWKEIGHASRPQVLQVRGRS